MTLTKLIILIEIEFFKKLYNPKQFFRVHEQLQRTLRNLIHSCATVFMNIARAVAVKIQRR